MARLPQQRMASINAGPVTEQSLPPWELDHRTGDYALYSLRTVRGFFNDPQNLYMQGLLDGAYGLSSLSEKTRKSNCSQISLHGQHFLFSYLKTLSLGPALV